MRRALILAFILAMAAGASGCKESPTNTGTNETPPREKPAATVKKETPAPPVATDAPAGNKPDSKAPATPPGGENSENKVSATDAVTAMGGFQSPLVLGGAALARFVEEQLVYPGITFKGGQWNQPALDPEDVFFSTADGVRLNGWYVKHEQPKVVILYCHGNGGNITHRADILVRLRSELDASIFIFDYRGYGRSQGSPSEHGVIEDGRAALKWLSEKAGVPRENIVLMGRSLGGGIAVALAGEGPCRALVLESTFANMPEVAGVHYPWIPARLLMTNRFDSIGRIARYKGPLLQSHSIDDEVIPFESGKRLFDACGSTDKTFFTMKNKGHNDPQPQEFYDKYRQLVERTAEKG